MILFIGNSHLAAIERAYKALSNDEAQELGEASFIQMDGRHVPPFRRTANGPALNSALEELLDDQLKPAELVVSVIGGNGHNILGLVNMSPPIDFFDSNDQGFAPNHMIIPRPLVKAALNRRIEDWLRLMLVVRERVPVSRMLHISPPPPIADPDYILNNPGPFKQQFEDHGLADARVRLKLWRLHEELLIEICTKHGITFISAPNDGVTDEGYLLPEYYGGDPSHANTLYGKKVLEIIKGSR
ncbi:hypothetical protein [Brucella pituitosa]|uniref:hypothetical protein n=1 Tax=Brucella pituitosa TaxID=571256 RepID=UPI003F4A991C